MTSASRQRVWRAAHEVDLLGTLGVFRRGGGDPTWWQPRRGEVVRGVLTPQGPATLQLRAVGSEVAARAWGPGAVWALESVPGLLGEGDDVSGFSARGHPVIERAWARRPGWRVPRSGLVWEALLCAVIEQKVTGQEAFGGYRRLVCRFGAPAPGPAGERGLMVPPGPEVVAQVPSWAWLEAGISPERSRVAVRAARVASRLERAVDLPVEQAHALLRQVSGIGRWTAAEVAQRALGDADAVSYGDYHVARQTGWALTGQDGVDDLGLAALLAPWAGQRYRVARLAVAEAGRIPRRGARMAPRTHLPTRP